VKIRCSVIALYKVSKLFKALSRSLLLVRQFRLICRHENEKFGVGFQLSVAPGISVVSPPKCSAHAKGKIHSQSTEKTE